MDITHFARRLIPITVAAAWTIGSLAGCPVKDLPTRNPEPDPIELPTNPEPQEPEPGSPAPGEPSPGEPDTPTPDVPVACEDLEAVAVPILPRSSNDEVLQLYSDLVGAPVDPDLFARWTPLAQVRGFDTMTESRIDAQTLEEQLNTTEAVAELLVNTPAVMASCPTPTEQVPLCPVYANYDATAQFSGLQGQDCWSYLDSNGTPLTFNAGTQRWISTDPGLFVWNTGVHPGIGVDVMRRWTAPVDGLVTLQGTVADADGGGGNGIIVEIRGPAGTLFQAVIVNGGAAETFNLSLALHQGDTLDIVVQRNNSNAYDSTALTATVGFVAVPSADGLDWDSCGLPVVERVASRAWRRPLRAEELVDLKVVFDETSASAVTAGIAVTFVEGLKSTLQAALLSPHVQYKPEFVPGTYEANEDGFRRASRLALYFRSSFPDDELWALATAGALDDAAVTAQAQRLLASDGARFVDNFGGQWLNFRGAIGASEDPLAQSMRREAHDVFAVILDDNLPPANLIAPGFTVVDGLLANHYGLAADINAGPARIETTERGGLFTQGHFLTSASTGSDFKRVIHRGIFALNRTLCSTVPPLDPATLEEIAESVNSIDPDLPLAERMELHRDTTPRCIGCHSQMDPLGLALEHFDDAGRWRDTYPDGSAIDNGFDFNGVSVRNPGELEAYVGESDNFRRCVAEKLFTFGLNRSLRTEESCVIDSLVASDAAPRSLHDIAIDAFLTSLALTETP